MTDEAGVIGVAGFGHQLTVVHNHLKEKIKMKRSVIKQANTTLWPQQVDFRVIHSFLF